MSAGVCLCVCVCVYRVYRIRNEWLSYGVISKWRCFSKFELVFHFINKAKSLCRIHFGHLQFTVTNNSQINTNPKKYRKSSNYLVIVLLLNSVATSFFFSSIQYIGLTTSTSFRCFIFSKHTFVFMRTDFLVIKRFVTVTGILTLSQIWTQIEICLW